MMGGEERGERRGGGRGRGDREGGFRGGDREGGFRGGDREGGYRRREDRGEGAKEGGAPGEFAPTFRGGFGRGRGAPPAS